MNGASGDDLVSSRPRSRDLPCGAVVRGAVHVGSLVSPPQMTGIVTTSPGASVRGSLLASGKQSLLPQIRLPERSYSSNSCSPLSSARTQGTAETLATSSSNVGLLPTATVPGVRTSR